VINLAELRLYYYPKNRPVVITYPVGVGLKGWQTPLANTSVISKTKNPVWRVPASIQQASLKHGITPPTVVPPGPRNPLGKYALRLGLGSYLLHGTRQPDKVGERVSAGCIRLRPEAIRDLYAKVPVGTPVRIVHEPYKVGWANGRYYLEAHGPLSEYKGAYQGTSRLKSVVSSKSRGHSVNWSRAVNAGKSMSGVPTVIGG